MYSNQMRYEDKRPRDDGRGGGHREGGQHDNKRQRTREVVETVVDYDGLRKRIDADISIDNLKLTLLNFAEPGEKFHHEGMSQFLDVDDPETKLTEAAELLLECGVKHEVLNSPTFTSDTSLMGHLLRALSAPTEFGLTVTFVRALEHRITTEKLLKKQPKPIAVHNTARMPPPPMHHIPMNGGPMGMGRGRGNFQPSGRGGPGRGGPGTPRGGGGRGRGEGGRGALVSKKPKNVNKNANKNTNSDAVKGGVKSITPVAGGGKKGPKVEVEIMAEKLLVSSLSCPR